MANAHLLSSIYQFIDAILDHWLILMSGGLISVVIGVCERWKEKPLHITKYAWVMGVFVLGASFLAWRDEHDAVASKSREATSLRAELDDLKTPNLSATILGLIAGVGNQEGREATVVFAPMEIKNTGAPSVAYNYRVTVTLSSGKKVPCLVQLMPPGAHAPIDGRETAFAHAEDALYDKTETKPIEKGGRVVGTLFFEVPGVDRQTLTLPGTDVEIEFEDVLGKKHSCHQSFTGQQGTFRYIPGLKLPEFAPKP